MIQAHVHIIRGVKKAHLHYYSNPHTIELGIMPHTVNNAQKQLTADAYNSIQPTSLGYYAQKQLIEDVYN